MQATKTTTAERAAYWTQIIKEARQYEGGVGAYCNDHGIPKRQYYEWFPLLRKEHPEWQNLMNSRSQSSQQNRGNATKKPIPPTEVKEKTTRRYFSAAQKVRILQEIDAASPGAVAAILRREGLYSSHLQKWRSERDKLARNNGRRGPKADPLAAEIKKLKTQNERLEKKLNQANKVIEFQKKVSELLGVTLDEMSENE